MRKVLALFLALVLSISCLSEGEVVETSPEVTEAPIVEEVTNETTEVVEESRDEVPEKVEEVVTEESRETVQETPAVVEDTLETVEPETPEEPVNEQEAEEPDELEPVPQEKPSKDVEDSNVDDSGTGSTEHDEILSKQSKAETETSTESGEADMVAEDKTSEKQCVEEIISDVISTEPEEVKDEEETGLSDVGDIELVQPDTKPEEEVSAEDKEEQLEEPKEVEPEEALEDAEQVETEKGDEQSDLEESVEQVSDEVSEGDSVLKEETVDEKLPFGMTPVFATAKTYTMNFEGRTTLYATDKDNTDVVTFTSDIPDEWIEIGMYKGGKPEKTIVGYLWNTAFWTNFHALAAKVTLTYAELYSMLDEGSVTVTVRMHYNSDGIGNVWKTITFTKLTIDQPSIVLSVASGNVYPGDQVKINATYTITSNGVPLTGTENKYSIAIVWVIDNHVPSSYESDMEYFNSKGISMTKAEWENLNGTSRSITWTATSPGVHYVYAVLRVYY